VSGFALHRFHRNDTTVSGIAVPGVFIGLGISAMHYTGMAAMRMLPSIDYDPLLFTTSILVAIGAAIAALWIAFSLPYGRGRKHWHKIAAASVMGAAIVGMHYTAWPQRISHRTRFASPVARAWMRLGSPSLSRCSRF